MVRSTGALILGPRPEWKRAMVLGRTLVYFSKGNLSELLGPRRPLIHDSASPRSELADSRELDQRRFHSCTTRVHWANWCTAGQGVDYSRQMRTVSGSHKNGACQIQHI